MKRRMLPLHLCPAPLLAGPQCQPNLPMVWSLFLHLLSQLASDENQCCVEVLMESEATVSVSIIGIAVYIAWGITFLSLICLLFFLGLTPSQRLVLNIDLGQVPSITYRICKQRESRIIVYP